MLDLKVTDALFALLRTVFKPDAEFTDADASIIRANLDDIYKVCKRNDIAHLVGHALEKHGLVSPDDKIFTSFQKRQYIAQFRYEGMEYEISRVRELFESCKIQFILLKGAAIRKYYPEGWMRTSGDVDVLVHREDLERAEELFITRLGYETGVATDHDRSFETEGGIHIELHFSLMEDGKARDSHSVLDNVWDEAHPVRENSFECEISEEMFYCYHIAHLAKHMRGAGAGIRPFMDLWLMNTNFQYDREKQKEFMQRCSLELFAALCDELSEYWFGQGGELSPQANKLALFVLNCGIYGSEENRIVLQRKDNGSTLSYIRSRLFYPRSEIERIYPFTKKHKWLIPFCHMHRWSKVLTGRKTKKAIKEIKISRETTKNDIVEMRSFMVEMGIEKDGKES